MIAKMKNQLHTSIWQYPINLTLSRIFILQNPKAFHIIFEQGRGQYFLVIQLNDYFAQVNNYYLSI